MFQSKRFKWLISSLEEHFNINRDNLNIEDELRSKKNLKTFESFFNGDDNGVLMFYYQPQGVEMTSDETRDSVEPQFFMTTGDEESIMSKGVYLIRTQKKALDLAETDSGLVMGEIHTDSLSQMFKMIDMVFQPMIEKMENKDWGECDQEHKKEFLANCTTFANEIDEGLETLRSNHDECRINRDDLENIPNEMEKTLLFSTNFENWLKNFNLKLRKMDSEHKKDAEKGPRTELTYWRKILQDVTLQIELTKSSDFVMVREHLKNQNKKGDDKHAKLLNDYRTIEATLTERLNEAKDNVKYLVTLEKFINPLYEGTSEEIIDTLPALMNAIKMIHTIARYYNTNIKMTNLFRKITNQMIINCRQRILEGQTHDKIWSKDPEKLIRTFESCIILCQKYKAYYEQTKRKATELPKSRHWDFDDSVIFGKFDLFIKRIKKLIELFGTVQQFNALQKHNNLEGMSKLTANFNSILDWFKSKNHNLLAFESIELEKDYVSVMQKIQKLDSQLQLFIDTNFAKLKNISYSLRLLKKFESIMKRDNIRNRLTHKYESILQNYGCEIDTILKLFEEQKANPPVLRNMPADAGKIIWVRHLFAKLNGPIEEFPPNLINRREMKKYIEKFNLIGKNLIIYELYFTQSWVNDIDRAKLCLQTTLLVMKEENGVKKIKVNFEKDIQKLIREAKALDREGIGAIPESAKIILLQEEKFKRYYYELEHVKNEYARITENIKPIMKTLLTPHIEDFDLKLRPGMVTLTWTSMNIDSFLRVVNKGLQRLDQLVFAVNDIIDNRIENNLRQISNVVLVKLPSNSKPMSLDDFVESQQSHITETAEMLISNNLEVERAVDDLLQMVIGYRLDSNIDPVDTSNAKLIKQYYFWYLYQALLNSTQYSLNLMKDRVCGKGSNKTQPFFEVNVTLEEGDVKLKPSLNEIQKAINRAATAVLSCSKQLLGWDQVIQGDEDAEKESYYKIIAQDKEIAKVILLLTGSVQGTRNKVNEFMKSFLKYKWLWTDSVGEYLKKFSKRNMELEDYERELKKFTELENEIERIDKVKDIGAMSLKMNDLVIALKALCKEWKSFISEDLHNKAKEKLTGLIEGIKTFSTKLNKEVKEIDSLGMVMNTLEEIRKEQSESDLKFAPVLEMYALLETYVPGAITDKEEMDNRQLLLKKWDNLIKLADVKQKELQQEQGKNLKTLKENIRTLVSSVKKLRKNFENEGPMVQGISPKEASDRLKRFENEYELKCAFYNINKRGEDLFGLENMKYPELVQTKHEIENLNKLYALYNQVNETTNQWEDEAWSEIDVVQMRDWEDSIQKYSDQCLRLPRDLREWPAYMDLKVKIENYKNILPFMKELKEPMIKKRHWNKIIEITGKKLNFAQPENFYFKELIDANLLEYFEDIEDIIDSAKKQDKIEKTKDEITAFWDKEEFIFKDWGIKRKVKILSGMCVEEVQEKLDEDISTLSGLSAMRHVTPFKDDVQSLQEMLTDIQATLDLWVKVQILWTSLERVFTEGDISMILTTESKKFAKIDKAWIKTIMEKATEQRLVKLCCQNEIIKSILPNLQEELEACQKQLEKYLEMKRKAFPRFYFASNLVLLKFLSQGSDPESVQEDFDKLYDAISKVEFKRVDKKTNTKMITKLINCVGNDEEFIDLEIPVVCADYIEKWLLNLEKSMQHSINGIIRKVSFKIGKNVRDGSFNLEEFINQQCAQVALVGLQLKWTKLMQDALEKKSNERNRYVNEAKSEMSMIMDILTDICRKKNNSKLFQKKIEALVTIMVYLNEVTTAWKFREINDFEWLKNTRINWSQEKDQCMIAITDWEVKYSNEYLGVKERLCVTPLTDRCYISLAQAMSMHYGGAPAGPAGTGKTETVKDLGKTLGIYVVVINCSKEYRYKDMAKIFKGICQSGVWTCFDEFNRIEVEVLSVVAMQIESITSAKKAGISEFLFPDEVDKIKLIPTCGYFITMNPTYAGRVQLPENLKVLFRGVTMMVPDRDVIIRVKLASQGYKEYKELSKKFTILYSLCEEQLSKQKHYDFGLRNILSVLRFMGNDLREQSDNPNEEKLMMNTLRNMNLSKLIMDDVPLFNALMRDIFPRNSDPDKKKETKIKKKIIEKVRNNNLMVYDPWILKVIQLYETSEVRHGFMLVGPTMSGKTTILNTLVEALSEIPDSRNHKQKYVVQRINPKALTVQELFGVKNFSGEWTPGIFSEIWRKANEKKPNKPIYWIVCDGPVDTIWIENLNTVLDDNRVLTLPNSDRIFMLDSCRLIFEVENLDNASLATVSRCGQIYVSQGDLGYKSIIEGFMKIRTKEESQKMGNKLRAGPQADKIFHKDEKELMMKILMKYLETHRILERFRKSNEINSVMNLDDSLLAVQVLKLLNGLVCPFLSSKNCNKSNLEEDFEKMVLFSLLWGIAGVYEQKDRLDFQELLRTLEPNAPLPSIGHNESLFDYKLKISDRGVDWRLIELPHWKPPTEFAFSQILMPTIDSTRASILIDLIAKQNKGVMSNRSVLIVGGSGTAKTSSVLMYSNKFNSKNMLFHRINFSSATQPCHFQTSIESVCDTKIRKGFGPKDGKMMTVFIDDFSMPEKNKWGDQITLEIVRQLMEDSGFYRLEKNERGNFKFIENLQYIAAMNHPLGGRNNIPNRIKKYFYIFNQTLPSRIDIIYNPILAQIFKPSLFSAETNLVIESISTATIKLWDVVKNSLLPSPSKFHYVFNLRDVSRIFKGMCCIKPSVINDRPHFNEISPELYLVALWRNECERVFVDKLINKKDKETTINFINEISLECFPQLEKGINEVLMRKKIMFCDFLNENPDLEDDDFELEEIEKVYEGIADMKKLRSLCMGLLKVYNRQYPQRKMDLVLFDDALYHLIKISRIIQMPRSSALLVGVGGSGKQSLTRLAANIGKHQLSQITLTKTYNENNLKEDIKNLFDIAGHRGKKITFIMTDAEVKNENFLEYINMVLSTGEIPGLIPKDEKEIWMGDCRTDFVKKFKDNKEPSHLEVYNFFLNRLKDNLHIVLCFSPVGVHFRERSRKFPAIFNECCINWFLPWPKEAMMNVADQYLKDFTLEATKEVHKELSQWMADIHLGINETCNLYLTKMRRYVFVTPKSFLSFLKAYKKLYKEKYSELDEAEKNFKVGLQKIADAKDKIETLEKHLKIEEEKVRQKKEEVEKIITELNEERGKANKKNEEVMIEKKKIEEDKKQIEADKMICEKELAEALPALKRAQNAANQITPKEISEVKPTVIQMPHIVLKYVVDAIQIVLYQNIRKDITMLDKPVYATKKQEKRDLIVFFQDSWEYSGKAAFFDPTLADKLKMMAKTENENLINSEILELLEPYTRCLDTWLCRTNATNVFHKLGLIHDWMVQIEKFSKETKNIKPKRQALAQQEEKFNAATAKLEKAKAQLEEIQSKCKELDQNFKKNNDEKIELEEQARKQKKKIDQANRLINSLSDERDRWNKGANELSYKKKRLVGNVGLSTGFISYCGPFNAEFRDLIANNQLIDGLKRMEIPFSKNIYNELTSFLVDEATIGQWNLDGLPKDILSIQNGIMVESSERYPLLIDPQEQGIFWIKNKFKEINPDTNLPMVTIVSIKEEKKFRDALNKCIENGEVLIIEGIENEIDPILDPILEKQLVKKGRKMKISVGGIQIDWNPNFKLFLTCKLGNPKFSPELSAKTTIIDFTVTQNGLEQQLLSVVLTKKQRALEESLNNLMKEVTNNKKELKKLDESLLKKLTTCSSNLLDDPELVDILNNTKTQAKEMQVKLSDADVKTKEINEKRLTYKPVSIRGSVLYFCMIEIAQVNWMYNSSLTQFLDLYHMSIDNAPKATLPSKQAENIEKELTYNVYRYVNRGLFEKDKTTFKLMVCFKILITDKKLNSSDVSLFLRAGAVIDKSIAKPKPTVDWLSEKMWMNVIALAQHCFFNQTVPFFKSLPEQIQTNIDVWKKWAYEKTDPENAPIPFIEEKIEGEKEIGDFLRLCVIRCLREDRTLDACVTFINQTFGDTKYSQPVSDSIESLQQSSNSITPILFLLSVGSDPTTAIDELAKKKRRPISKVSLGEGQEMKADSLIQSSLERGDWVLLQNCHLGMNFMSYLDTIISDEEFLERADPEFRIWMSCEPRQGFPLGLLQKSLKVTNEPPKGIKAGLHKTFSSLVNPEFLERIDHPNWRTLTYATCFLHSLIQERKKFGSLGWCSAYEFNFSDLAASLAFIEKYLNQLQNITGITNVNQNFNISHPVLIYMIAEIQYGGRITDYLDRELMVAYAEQYFRDSLITNDLIFGKVQGDGKEPIKYTVPVGTEHKHYLDFIDKLPDFDSPEIFGMNPNADITCRLKETNELIYTIMETRPKDSSGDGGKTREEIIQVRAKELLTQLNFEYPEAETKELIRKLAGPRGYPHKGFQVPMNIFLSQEIQRMQRVIELVKKTLYDIDHAIEGQIIMTPQIVDAIDSIFDGKVPNFWIYDSTESEISWLKPSFGLWFESLMERNQQLNTWLRRERPRTFNLGYFFNPLGFLTSMKQEMVRSNKHHKSNSKQSVEWSMDNVDYQTQVLSDKQQKEFENSKDHGGEGVYLTGLYLEGCRWNRETLAEANEKKMTYPLNILYVTAVANNSKKGPDAEKKEHAYYCPVYKYPIRGDQYLIFRVYLPCSGGATDAHKWKLRGVALLCSTD
jgi:dynein heavy chain